MFWACVLVAANIWQKGVNRFTEIPTDFGSQHKSSYNNNLKAGQPLRVDNVSKHKLH